MHYINASDLHINASDLHIDASDLHINNSSDLLAYKYQIIKFEFSSKDASFLV